MIHLRKILGIRDYRRVNVLSPCVIYGIYRDINDM